mmetsp:Transcript_11555/g.46725  ORF Transcript_11555/g.46725 Transcript_11555/m.46725 type:complete len:231 (-) Transcript_11555:111-803(-)
MGVEELHDAHPSTLRGIVKRGPAGDVGIVDIDLVEIQQAVDECVVSILGALKDSLLRVAHEHVLHLLVVPLLRDIQRSSTLLVLLDQRAAGIEHQFDHAVLAAIRTQVETVPAVLVALGDVSVVLEEKARDLLAAPAAAEIEGRAALLVHQLHSSASVHEQLYNVEMAVETRPKERSPVLVVASVHLGAALGQEHLHVCHIALLAGGDELCILLILLLCLAAEHRGYSKH